MSEQEVIEVQRGVWIGEQQLQEAGIGPRLEIVTRPGQILIRGVPTDATTSADGSERGWSLFLSLGREAKKGRLPKAASEHDRYLYGRTQ